MSLRSCDILSPSIDFRSLWSTSTPVDWVSLSVPCLVCSQLQSRIFRVTIWLEYDKPNRMATKLYHHHNTYTAGKDVREILRDWASKVRPTSGHNCVRNVTFRDAYMLHTFKGHQSKPSLSHAHHVICRCLRLLEESTWSRRIPRLREPLGLICCVEYLSREPRPDCWASMVIVSLGQRWDFKRALRDLDSAAGRPWAPAIPDGTQTLNMISFGATARFFDRAGASVPKPVKWAKEDIVMDRPSQVWEAFTCNSFVCAA